MRNPVIYVFIVVAVFLGGLLLQKKEFLKETPLLQPTITPIGPTVQPSQGYNCCNDEQISKGFVCMSRNNCGPAGLHLTEYHCLPKGTTYIPCGVL